MFRDIFKNKTVLLTGHTGFKGSWLAQWLLSLGARVHGYALDPLPEAVLYHQLGLARRLASDSRGDLAESSRLNALVEKFKPDFLFHLAAQPLVRLSYSQPVETFATNVMGTIHVLESLRRSNHPCVAVMVTTDKCYENREWLHGYREEDPMGGFDPYSASKGAAEIAISAYRRSFFSHADSNVLVASGRAGNVIGGGDWAKDRIVPDIFRSLNAGQPIAVRNKVATRPWQHVLEPLSGYLLLAASMAEARLGSSVSQTSCLGSAFNFGPALTSNRSVAELVQKILQHTGGSWVDASDPHAPHEASKLNLCTDKAFHVLGWQPVWNFDQTIAKTAWWYSQSSSLPPAASRAGITDTQIEEYTTTAEAMELAWATSTSALPACA